MKRRSFIKNSLITAVPTGVLTSCKNNTEPLKNHISGFIISDAHIGWQGEAQPTIQEQIRAIKVIKKKFPDIDLFFDTGDIHHGNLNENERVKARDSWLTHLVNPFSESIFHYIPGNHELQKGPYDTEITATSIGNQNFRPYYSFDYKGVHFISLPQLRDTILISKESLDWLEHDLLVNQNKTTLVFSHNSISNTTYTNGESSYREVINSSDVLDILDKYNNVIAWFHGHNHQYEIVNKQNRLYVSNGRIGGFNPPSSWGKFGQGHLGGVYFEINNDGLKVKCFSATENAFLSEVGFENLSHELKTNTSFEKSSGLNYYFGHGNLSNNVTHDINNYYLSNKKVKVLTKQLKDQVLNENTHFKFPTELSFSGRSVNRIVGYHLRPKHLVTKTVDDGVLIKNLKGGTILLTLPTMKKVRNQQFLSRPGYFRCESGDQFAIDLEYKLTNVVSANAIILLTYYVFNEFHEIIFKTDEKKFEKSRLIDEVDIPDNLVSNGRLKYFKVELKLVGFPMEFVLHKFLVNKIYDQSISGKIQFGNQQILSLEPEINIKNNSINEGSTTIRYVGSKPVSCIIKIKEVEWQVRNAVTTYKGSTIRLLRYNHSFQSIPEVILTPVRPMRFFVNKVVNIMPLEISYITNGVVITATKLESNSKFIIKSTKESLKIKGGDVVNNMNGLITIVPNSKTVTVLYSS